MASSAKTSRIFPPRSRKSYRLEMESRTLYLLLSLMALTGVVVFYLGVVTGKALRNPNTTVPLSAEIRTPAAPATPEGGQLAFNNALQPQKGLIEGLRQDESSATRRTENLLKQSKQLELEEVPRPGLGLPTAPVSKIPATPPAASVAAPGKMASPPRPAAVRPPAPVQPPDGSLYTVQVFSSRYQKNAQEMVRRLKTKGFPAYMNRFESADKQVVYRVRVGRTSKARAQTLSDQLKQNENMRDPVITKL